MKILHILNGHVIASGFKKSKIAEDYVVSKAPDGSLAADQQRIPSEQQILGFQGFENNIM